MSKRLERKVKALTKENTKLRASLALANHTLEQFQAAIKKVTSNLNE